MNWISHRGNINGPNPAEENKPEYIKIALRAGYDVEIDIWLQPDGLYLGHDAPTYKTDRHFLQNQRLWVHCKNILAYLELSKFTNINCFFQEEEEMVMTSRGYLWAHSKCKQWNDNTVIVKLDSRNWVPDILSLAICSDYVGEQAPSYKLPFDLLIVDIDGVMTDGTKMYDRDGKVFGKTYCDLDFTAIKRFIASGIQVCFLSGDQIVNKAMAETRKIPFYHNAAGTDKTELLPLIKAAYGAKNIAYIGDDYYDLAIMDSVNLAFCPQNSPNVVKAVATVIDADAGKGVLAKLYDKFENEIKYAFPKDSANVNPQ